MKLLNSLHHFFPHIPFAIFKQMLPAYVLGWLVGIAVFAIQNGFIFAVIFAVVWPMVILSALKLGDRQFAKQE
jgi:hypothetical protein